MKVFRSIAGLLGVAILVSTFGCYVRPAQSAELTGNVSDQSDAQIIRLTRDILLKGAEIGRLILRYRLENVRPPRTRLIRYSLAQETGSATALAFEIIADKEFGDNQRTPLRVNKTSLDHAGDTVLTGTIIAGSASAFELSSNFWRMMKNKRAGLDSRSAEDKFVKLLGEFDNLLAQHQRLVEAQTGRLKELLTLEDKVMQGFRQRMIIEFVLFERTSITHNSYENTYFFLNAATNALAATSAGCLIKSLTVTHYAGPANVLFLLAGALTMASPELSVATSAFVGRRAQRLVLKRLGLREVPIVDDKEMEADLKRIDDLSGQMSAERLALAGPVVERAGIYSTASERFRSLVDREDHRNNLLRQVAVQSVFLGPAIGATLMTQGILGTDAYFNYQRKPIRLSKLRTADRLSYAGSVVGTVGTATAVGATPLLLAAALAYRYHEGKKRMLPWQLLEDRIAKLDEVTDKIKQMPAGP